ncbi:histidine kinase [Sorangium sp. So ce185]|uniref:sensor histidine kinase n=1 Tax=Sorangium sp. So ce185 TaxID=3133287 RepID=UPI003F5E7659
MEPSHADLAAAEPPGWTVNGGAGATHVALPPPAAAPARGRAPARALAGPRWAAVWLVAGLWMIPVLVSSAQTYLFVQQKQEARLPLFAAFVWQGLPWLFWALMTPAIVWLGRRFPMERRGLVRNVAVHLVANLAMAPGHVAVSALMGRLIGHEHYVKTSFPDVFVKLISIYLDIELLIYWGILAMVHAADYHRKYRERAVAAAQLETKLAQAELQALKMQLHPHFLFNTLHAIAVLVRKQETQASVRMITGLSELLRMALENAGKQIVPLKQELDFLDRYLEIEETRFQDRLTVRKEVAPEALDAEIPNLILQPIVENAIRHGIAPRASSGSVTIAARREDHRLVVEVTDDGRGLREGWAGEASEGTGLGNVRARLRQLYPDDHRLAVARRPEGGVLVTVAVPFRPARPQKEPRAHG